MSNRLPDYWTHLDGTPCRRPRLADVFTPGVPVICDEHDRLIWPPLNAADDAPIPFMPTLLAYSPYLSPDRARGFAPSNG